MGSMVQVPMFCSRDSVDTVEAQTLESRNGASNLLLVHGNGFRILQPFGNLLEVKSKKAAKEPSKIVVEDPNVANWVYGRDDEEADLLLTTDRKRSTLKDLLEQSGKEEEQVKGGSQVVESQEGKDHPDNSSRELNESKCALKARVAPGMPEDHVVVAVNKDQSSKDALMWALSHLIRPADSITLLHVRLLTRNISGPRQVNKDAVNAHIRDTQRAREIVEEHQRICTGNKVKSEIVIVEGDAVAKTLVEQISKLRVTKLVLGTSPRNLITWKLKSPQIPAYVAKHTPPFCTVMAVSKNRLISVKEAQCLLSKVSRPQYNLTQSMPIKSSTNVQIPRYQGDDVAADLSLADMAPYAKQTFTASRHTEAGFGSPLLQSVTPRTEGHGRSASYSALMPLLNAHTGGKLSQPDVHYADYSFTFSRSKSPQQSHANNLSAERDLSGNGGLRAASLVSPVPLGYRSMPNSPRAASNLYSTNMKVIEINKLESAQQAKDVEEIASFTVFKFEEESSSMEPAAGLALLDSPLLLDEIENLRVQLEMARKDAELNGQRWRKAEEAAAEALSKAEHLTAKHEEEAKMTKEALMIAEDAKLHAIEEERKCFEALELARAAQHALEEEMQRRLKAEERSKEEAEARQAVWAMLQKSPSPYREYTYEELRSACDNFTVDRKLGEGGYGVVYQGKLHHTTVAIKVLNSDGLQGPKEFQREVELLGRIHHPHMVMLLGCCPHKGCLVYEYMANGSLEDRLLCKANTPPLPWNMRFRIAAEVATALLFLHSSSPDPIVHLDLKPANVLLDKNFVSKIGDVGLAKLVPERHPGGRALNSTYFRDTIPVGTLAYIDPEYQRTGSFGPKSDVYALGILILQLLTSRPPVGVFEVVEEALEDEILEEVLDYSAGEWPLDETKELASLALKCAEMRRKNRPDLETRVLPVLDNLRNFAEGHTSRHLYNGPPTMNIVDNSVPNMFICPIYQELMEDPVMAADGHTYEYKAIQQWLEVHETSPMTNLRLPHRQLTPNHALRSAIYKWEAAKCKRKH